MTDEQFLLDTELKLLFATALNGVEVETSHAGVVYQKRIQLCGGILRGEDDAWTEVNTDKIGVLQKVVANNPESKIVVWHTYIPETTLLQNALADTGVPVFTFDSPDATEQIESFASADAPALLLIRTSLCKGLNQLADADIAVYYSNPLSYARRAQSEGRTRRITSTNEDTHYVDIITEGGADSQVYGLLRQKKSCSLTLTVLREMIDCNML